MHISYKLDRSPIHGIGLFTAEDVAKGQLIYTASPVIDMDITDDQFKSLSATEKKEIQYWGFFDEPSQCWHVDFDVSKFINHAYDGTVTQDERHDDAHDRGDACRGRKFACERLAFLAEPARVHAGAE